MYLKLDIKIKASIPYLYQTDFVIPVISFQTARWSALLVGVFYGKQRFEYLKPIAEEEQKIEEAEKKAREEQERIYKQLSEASSDTILK